MKRWSPEEDALLRELWPLGRFDEVSVRLGRSHAAIRCRASGLKIAKAVKFGMRAHDPWAGCTCVVSKRCWTPKQVAYVVANYGRLPVSRMAKKIGRSEASIKLKAARLGVGIRDSGLTVTDLTGIFAVAARTVQEWIRSGQLRSRKVSYPTRAGFVYLVDEDDLLAFIDGLPWLFDRDRMPESYYRDRAVEWVTVTEAFRRGAPHPVTIGSWVRTGLVPEARRRGCRIYVPAALVGELAGRARRPGSLYRDLHSVAILDARYARRARAA